MCSGRRTCQAMLPVIALTLAWLRVVASASNGSETTTGNGWGEWSLPSGCSRTCGGGVAVQTRECLRFDQNCQGPSKLYNLCYTQDCPANTVDFRQLQCQKYNNVPFKGTLYEWIPYYGAKEKCELNCAAKGANFYMRQAAQVIDGTPCDRTSTDICVSGVCQSLGCDKKLGSIFSFDNCRVCGGDNSTCHEVSGQLETSHLAFGYTDILILPKGSTNIVLEETNYTKNYFAVRNADGEYYLNGHWSLVGSWTGTNDSISYTSKSLYGHSLEKFTANGPTSEVLFVSLIRQQAGQSAPIKYRFFVPNEAETPSDNSFFWESGPWSPCSASCGIGYHTRSLNCRSGMAIGHVADELCDPLDKPISNETCMIKACPSFWHVGEWEPCSTTCGEGVRIRTAVCKQQVSADIVAVAECAVPRPVILEKCNANITCPQAKWRVGEWSKCDRQCGRGKQNRTVQCEMATNSANATTQVNVVADNICNPATRPNSTQECLLQPCDGLAWITSGWTPCSKSCDILHESRTVACSSRTGKIYSEERCDESKMPEDERPCADDFFCKPQAKWMASPWTECTTVCGRGTQSRYVVCALVDTHQLRRVSEENCNATARLPDIKECIGLQCHHRWFTGPFGKCSAACGGGIMKRSVFCLAKTQAVNDSFCDPLTRPPVDQECNKQACDDDELIGSCRNTTFGCCRDGTTPAEGKDYLGCPPEDEIPVGACIESEFGCCHDNVKPALGPYMEGCPPLDCMYTEYGCCDDGVTAAPNQNKDGCPPPSKPRPACELSMYGCCLDGVTPATGNNSFGCPEYVEVKVNETELPCNETRYGCCSDGVTAAQDEKGLGCEEDGSGSGEVDVSCVKTMYGCCADGITAAKSANKTDCPPHFAVTPEAHCSRTTFGCCPDNITAAQGVNGTGCEQEHVPIVNCSTTMYGCCADGIHAALGKEQQGCPEHSNCSLTKYGCCKDNLTPALGADYQGCPMESAPTDCSGNDFGCCPDGVTPAEGPNHEGCEVTGTDVECAETVYGCCLDGISVASAPKFGGCGEDNSDVNATHSCQHSAFGCCEDGVTPAQGPAGSGCPHRVSKGAVCGMPSEKGSCYDYTVKWYFDVAYGDCTRFWYGGCEGNGNRYDTREECQQACISPDNTDVCYLPKSVGRCGNSQTKFYYNYETRQCEEFIYGGCLGNDNKFDTSEECELKCITPQRPDLCSQPAIKGACRGQFERFYYDAESGECQTFMYGGCGGNDNRFLTAETCSERCVERSSRTCQLPMDAGPCTDSVDMWYFNAETATCQQFVYGGCHGNLNRFATKQECESICRDLLKTKQPDVCALSMDAGSCRDYFSRWYYDKSDGYCKQFVYGGCGGNLNRFESESSCRQRCNAKPPVDVCTLMAEPGNCHGSEMRYYYDDVLGKCTEFEYTGCEGNGNNFETIEECAKVCLKIKPSDAPIKEKCLLPKDSGPCLKTMRRWYFDNDEQRCRQFTYGGCQGNRNKFLTEESCMEECMPTTTTTLSPTTTTTTLPPTDPIEPCKLAPTKHELCPASVLQWYYDGTARRCREIRNNMCPGKLNGFEAKADCEKTCVSQEVCMLSKDTGPCKASFVRWHFNAVTNDCEKFLYGGCYGNGNRFETREDCMQRCGKKALLAVCALPNDPGPCSEGQEKWYYDVEKGICDHFEYGGCNGNDNRFDTEAQCKDTCSPIEICKLSAETGPCKANKIRYAFSVALGDCEEFTYGGCQGNANRFLSINNCRKVCKPGANEVETDPTDTDGGAMCRLPKEEGTCDDYVVLWYYNSMSMQCEQFAYTGCDGNANRFSSFSSCEQACYKYHGAGDESPDYGTETDNGDNTGDDTGEGHDGGHHHGDKPLHVEHTTPAPTGGVCQLAQDPGTCYDWVIKWYYDAERAVCRRFYYGSCEGNGNRFDTEEACQQTCLKPADNEETETEGDGSDTPPEKGNVACLLPYDKGPCEALIVRWYYSAQDGFCRDFLFGGCEGNANNFASQVTCETECRYFSATKDVVPQCLEPRDAGPCHDIQPRWYFDQESGQCLEFSYGGCQGNNNNFESREGCEEICRSAGSGATTEDEQTDVCLLAKDAGPCTDDVLRYYYDSVTGQCRPFSYTGCQGNANNFATPDECYGYCGRGDSVTRRIYSPGDCFQTKDAGTCDSPTPRYYFDATTADCTAFYYTGCGGNKNNFYEREDCVALCSKAALTCGIFECELRCDYGYELDNLGCQTCKCHDPCEGKKCGEGESCQVEVSSCSLQPCPYQPVCKPEEEEDVCGDFTCELTACTYGYKKDEHGCDICECLDLCENHSCPNDYLCMVEMSQCDTPPCPYQPMCRPGCRRSMYGCCSDGQTPATGWNFQGCPDEAPVIDNSQSPLIVATLGKPLVIPCKVRASPAPTISWFRNRYPLSQKMLENMKMTQTAEGSLEIEAVKLEDDGVTYTCRAYNGIGSDTRTYSIKVNVPPTIEGLPSELTAVEDTDIVLRCSASGTPQPTVRWLRFGRQIDAEQRKYVVMENGSLAILNVKESDSGDYTCMATNDIGRPAVKTVTVNFQGLLKVDVVTENVTHQAGDNFELSCAVTGAHEDDVQFEWSKDGKRIDTEYKPVLYIDNAKVQDAGEYTCTARKGSQHVQASIRINIRGTVLPPNCVDRPYYANCQLIIEAHLCDHRYFKIFCCQSCFEAGMLYL